MSTAQFNHDVSMDELQHITLGANSQRNLTFGTSPLVDSFKRDDMMSELDDLRKNCHFLKERLDSMESHAAKLKHLYFRALTIVLLLALLILALLSVQLSAKVDDDSHTVVRRTAAALRRFRSVELEVGKHDGRATHTTAVVSLRKGHFGDAERREFGEFRGEVVEV